MERSGAPTEPEKPGEVRGVKPKDLMRFQPREHPSEPAAMRAARGGRTHDRKQPVCLSTISSLMGRLHLDFPLADFEASSVPRLIVTYTSLPGQATFSAEFSD